VRPSFSSFQSVIAFAAGLSSVVGAIYSGVQYVRPAAHVGEMVAVVRDARTDTPVRGGSIEVLTLENAVVATLTPADDGSARRPLAAGPYRLRVRHPRFHDETRQVEVAPGATVEVRFLLAQRGDDASRPTPIGAAKKFFRRLGL
jgi:hypothetical protein